MSLGQRRNDTLDAPPPGSPEKVSQPALPAPSGTLRQLARQLRLERRRAADPEALAAWLEESGYTDDWLRERGLGDVFEVAARLYALKTGGPRPGSAAPLEPPWALLWRGPLLVLIGLWVLSSAHGLGVPEAEAAACGGAVVAWGLGVRLIWLRQGARLGARQLRPRLLTGAALGSLAGALTALGLVASLTTATSGAAELGRAAVLGGILGGLYGLALTAAGLLLALQRRWAAVLVFGGALLLGELLRRSTPEGWSAAAAVVALLGLVAAAVGAVWLPEHPPEFHRPPRWGPEVRWPELRVTKRGAAERGDDDLAGSGWVGYGWALALTLAALAWRVGTAALLWPLLLFGFFELLAWLMQAHLRRLAQQLRDPARLVRAARWPVLGGPALLLLLGALGALLPWSALAWLLPPSGWADLGWLRSSEPGAAGALSSTWGSALLSAALLQSTWLARQPRERPRLTRLWLLGAGLLAAPPVSWWAALLLLLLTLMLLSDDALNDLTTYR